MSQHHGVKTARSLKDTDMFSGATSLIFSLPTTQRNQMTEDNDTPDQNDVEPNEDSSEPSAGQKDESAGQPVDGSPSTSAQEVVDTVHEAHTEQNPETQEDQSNG